MEDQDFPSDTEDIFSPQNNLSTISQNDMKLIDSTAIGTPSSIIHLDDDILSLVQSQLKLLWKTEKLQQKIQTLSKDKQKQMILKLFHMLHFERKSWTKDNAQLLVSIATIFTKKKQNKTSFVTDEILKLTTDNDKRVMMIGYQLCKEMVRQRCALKGMEEILKIGLVHPLPSHKLYALKMCLFAFELLRQQKEQKLIQISGKVIYKTVKFLIEQYNDAKALDILLNIACINLYLFQNISKEMMEYIRKLIDNSSIRSIKMAAIRFYITTISRIRPLQIESIFREIMGFMTEISPQIKEQWMQSCDEDYEQKHQKDDRWLINIGVNAICVSTHQFERQGPHRIAFAIIKQCLMHGDWRMQYAGITLLSKIAHFIQDGSYVKDDIVAIADFFCNDYPKLRSAACKAAEYISKKGPFRIQDYFANLCFPKLLDLIQVEKVPRVQYQALSALIFVIKSMDIGTLVNKLNQHVTLMLSLITNRYISQKTIELVFDTLGATVTKVKYKYDPFLLQTMNVFSAYFQYPEALNSHTAKVKGVQILIFKFLNLDQLKPTQDNINQLIQLVMDVQASFVGSKIPKQALEQLYSMFTTLFKSKYLRYTRPHFNRFFPNMLSIFQKDMESEIFNSHQGKYSKVFYNKYLWELFQTILGLFAYQLHLFISPIIRFLSKILREHTGQPTQIATCKALLKVLKKIEGQQQQLIEDLKMIFQFILKIIDVDLEDQEVRWFIRTLERLSKIPGMLSQQELLPFFEKWYQIFERINQAISMKKQKHQNLQKPIIGKTILMIGIVASPIIGCIFTYQNVRPEFAQHLLRDKIFKTFGEKQPNYISLFGISVASSILQTFGFSLFSKQLQKNMDKLLSRFMERTCLALRMGAWKWIEASFLKRQLSQKAIIEKLDIIMIQYIDTKSGIFQQLEKRYCQHIFAIIGKIIKAYCTSFDMHQYFSELLKNINGNPNNEQMSILMDIITENPQIVQGNQISNNFRKLFSAYQYVGWNQRDYDASVIKKIEQHTLALHFDASLDEDLKRDWKRIRVRVRTPGLLD